MEIGTNRANYQILNRVEFTYRCIIHHLKSITFDDKNSSNHQMIQMSRITFLWCSGMHYILMKYNVLFEKEKWQNNFSSENDMGMHSNHQIISTAGRHASLGCTNSPSSGFFFPTTGSGDSFCVVSLGGGTRGTGVTSAGVDWSFGMETNSSLGTEVCVAVAVSRSEVGAL